MDNRWLPAMERGALYEPFLLAECEAGGAQGTDRIRGVALNLTRGGNNLQLRQGILRLLHQDRRLPVRRMPHPGSRSPRPNGSLAPAEIGHFSIRSPCLAPASPHLLRAADRPSGQPP